MLKDEFVWNWKDWLSAAPLYARALIITAWEKSLKKRLIVW